MIRFILVKKVFTFFHTWKAVVEGFWGFVPPPLDEPKIAKSPTAQVNTLETKTWSHPESNGDPRFRKPLLYPIELWDRLRLIEVIFRL